VAIRLGGISWDVSINAASANRAFDKLDAQTKKLKVSLAQSTELFGGLGDRLNVFNRDLAGTQKSLGELSKEFVTVSKSGNEAKKEVAETGVAAKAATPLFATLAKSLAASAASFGALFLAMGGFKTLNFGKEAALLAARVKNLGTVVQNVGRLAGFSVAQINNFEAGIKSLGITTRAARQGLAQLSQANIDLAQSTKLTRIAQDAAVIAGIDSSEAFNRLVVSIQRNDVRLLRNLGIVINLNSVYRKFSQQTGQTVANLTAFEKRQIVLNEVLSKGALIAGTYEKSLGDAFKQLTSLRRKVEEATKAIGERFAPALEFAVLKTSQFFDAFENGTAIIGPKGIALFISATAIVGTLSVALGAAAAAFGALALGMSAVAVVGTPIAVAVGLLTAALTGLGIAIGFTALGWINFKLDSLAAAAALVTIQKEARGTAQAMVDAESTIESVTKVMNANASSAGNNESRYQDLREAAGALKLAFPKLAKEIQGAADSTTNARLAAQRLLEVFEGKLPQALLSTEERLKTQASAVKDLSIRIRGSIADSLTRAKVEDILTKSLERRLKIQRILNAPGSRATSGDVERALARETIKTQEEVTQARKDALTESISIADQDDLRLLESGDLRDRLSKEEIILIEARLDARNMLSQTTAAIAQRDIKTFKDTLKQVEQASNAADQLEGKIQTKSLARLRGTNAAKVRDALATQRKLIAIANITADSLELAAAKSAKAARSAEKQRLADNLEALRAQQKSTIENFLSTRALLGDKVATTLFSEDIKKFAAQIAKVEQEAQSAELTIVTNTQAALQAGIENRERAAKQESAALRLAKEANDDKEQLLRTEEEAIAGISVKASELIKVRQTERKELRLLGFQLEEFVKQREQQIASLKAAGASEAQIKLFDINPEAVLAASDESLKSLFKGLAEASRGIALNDREINNTKQRALKERAEIERKASEKEAARLARETARRIVELDRILKDEEKLIRQRVSLTEDGQRKLKLLTKKGVEDRLALLEKGGKKTVDFIKATQRRIAEGQTEGLGGVLSSLEDFQKAVAQATDAGQLANLKELFPKVIAENIKDAVKALDDAQKKLSEFDDTGLQKKRAAARGEVAARERELTEAGIKGSLFQEQIVRLQRQQRQEQEAERAKLAADVDKQKKRQKALQEAAKNGEDSLTKAIAERTKFLNPENKILGEIVALKEESLRISKEENLEIEKSLTLLAKRRDTLLGALKESDPAAAAEQAKKTEDAEAARRQDQERLQRLEGASSTPTGKGPPAGSPGSLPGQSDAEAALRGTRSGGDLGPGQFKGPKTPDAPKGPSPAAERALQKIEDDKNKTRLALTPGRFQGPKDPTPPAPTPKQDKAEAALEKLRQEQGLANAAGQAQAEADLAEQSGEAVKETVLATEAIATKNAETARLLEDLAKITKGEAADVAENFNAVTKQLLAQAKAGRAAFKRMPTSKK